MDTTTIHEDVVVDQAADAAEVQPEEQKLVSPRDQVIADIRAKQSADREAVMAEAGTDDGQPVAEQEPNEQPAAHEVQPSDRMVRIKVDGSEMEVPESEIIAEGIKAKQKLSAADARMRQAAQERQQLAAEKQRFLDEQRRLRDQIAQVQARHKNGGMDAKQIAATFTQALITDEEKATDMFASLLETVQRQQVVIDSLEGKTRESQEFLKKQQMAHQSQLVGTFIERFPHIARNPTLAVEANNHTKRLRHERPDLSDEQIVILAGELVESSMRENGWEIAAPQQETPAQAPAAPATPADVKRRMPRPPRGAAVRMPPPQEARKKTRSEIIAEQRQLRNPTMR